MPVSVTGLFALYLLWPLLLVALCSLLFGLWSSHFLLSFIGFWLLVIINTAIGNIGHWTLLVIGYWQLAKGTNRAPEPEPAGSKFLRPATGVCGLRCVVCCVLCVFVLLTYAAVSVSGPLAVVVVVVVVRCCALCAVRCALVVDS